MSLVQISLREGQDNRVPRGEDPHFELHLDDNQEIVSFEVRNTEYAIGHDDRKTVDWRYYAWVATRL